MNFKIKLFDFSDAEAYNIFLNRNKLFLWYVSLEYKLLLEKYLRSESKYWLVYNKNQIIACLPTFLSENDKFGTILNSLPFYGSNGSFLLDFELSIENKFTAMELLLNELQIFSEKEKISAITLITNPLDKESNLFLNSNFKYDFQDYRIGQVTPLLRDVDSLISIFENPRPRNIRKAIKLGVKISTSKSEEDFDFLFNTHHDNMLTIGGQLKPKRFFEYVQKYISANNYKLYIATLNGEKIAALLLFYFNDTVEYFTPATVTEFRNTQSSSLMIYLAMQDAADLGFSNWNWGGTWETQKGVYDFKKKWGAENKKYFYFTKIYNQDLLNKSSDELLKNYPNFYTLPFNQLKN